MATVGGRPLVAHATCGVDWVLGERVLPVETQPDSAHYQLSSYRESLVEHLFLGELLRQLWVKGVRDLEVLKPQVDDAGYDLLLVRRPVTGERAGSVRPVTRYLQLKASGLAASTGSVTLHRRLAERKGGCLVWVRFEEEFLPERFQFRWLGGRPEAPPIDPSNLSLARNPWSKKERKDVYSVPRSAFTGPLEWDGLLERLFPGV